MSTIKYVLIWQQGACVAETKAQLSVHPSKNYISLIWTLLMSTVPTMKAGGGGGFMLWRCFSSAAGPWKQKKQIEILLQPSSEPGSLVIKICFSSKTKVPNIIGLHVKLCSSCRAANKKKKKKKKERVQISSQSRRICGRNSNDLFRLGPYYNLRDLFFLFLFYTALKKKKEWRGRFQMCKPVHVHWL